MVFGVKSSENIVMVQPWYSRARQYAEDIPMIPPPTTHIFAEFVVELITVGLWLLHIS